MILKRKKDNDLTKFAKNYFFEKDTCIRNLNFNVLNKFVSILINAYKTGKFVFVCGNGGSASIASHLLLDHTKTISTNTSMSPKIYSLSSNIELMTAVSNDLEYSEVFSYQLNNLGNEGDILFVISSSGNSKNIIKAIEIGLKKKLIILSLTGFDGGLAKSLSHQNINVNSDNYGIIEDIHQSLMHILVRYIIQNNKNSTF